MVAKNSRTASLVEPLVLICAGPVGIIQLPLKQEIKKGKRKQTEQENEPQTTAR
jgi:hypothetical protein